MQGIVHGLNNIYFGIYVHRNICKYAMTVQKDNELEGKRGAYERFWQEKRERRIIIVKFQIQITTKIFEL